MTFSTKTLYKYSITYLVFGIFQQYSRRLLAGHL